MVAMAQSPFKTPLYDTHVAWGARMVDFAGWLMPVHFAGIKEEHVHTRTACSIFDVSHMGRLRLTGGGCESLLDRLCTRNLKGAEVGRSYYTHMCREDGGVLDDLIISRFESEWGIVCNAVNREKIVAWINRHIAGTGVTMRDETLSTVMIAIQGPRTLELARRIVDEDLSGIKRYRLKVFELMGLPITVYGSGYTGEEGFEVVMPAGVVTLLMPRLLGSKEKPHPVIKPAGLGARDTLRIEAAMPLYGHELSEEWDSLTAGQAWCVDLAKDFIGAGPLRELETRGVPRRLVGLELDGRRIARQHYAVYGGGRKVGEVTSGTLSPTLGKSIAMALVGTALAEEGSELEVEISGQRTAARVVKLPFYKRPERVTQ
jgi:aminomethyltransferase